MTAEAQHVLTILLVSLAAAYLIRRAWRYYVFLRTGKGGRCACGDTGAACRVGPQRVELEPSRRREGSRHPGGAPPRPLRESAEPAAAGGPHGERARPGETRSPT